VRVRGCAEVRAARMVAVGGDRGCQGATQDLGKIELCFAGIAPGHKNSANGVEHAAREAASARLIEAGILVKQRWKNRARHEVFNHAVSCGGPISLSVRAPALAEGRFAVVGLADRSQNSPPGILNVVESASSHHPKLLLRGEWRKFVRRFEAQEVRQRVKKPIVGVPEGARFPWLAGAVSLFWGAA